MMKFINELQMAIPICLRAVLMITRLDQSSFHYTSLNLKIDTLDSTATAAGYLSLLSLASSSCRVLFVDIFRNIDNESASLEIKWTPMLTIQPSKPEIKWSKPRDKVILNRRPCTHTYMPNMIFRMSIFMRKRWKQWTIW